MFLIKSAQAFYGLDQKQCWAFSYTVKRERTKIALLVPAQGLKTVVLNLQNGLVSEDIDTTNMIRP